MSDLFLTAEEVASLTDIRRGKNGKTRNELQCEHLRRLGIPFFPTVSGEPRIARAVIEGGQQKPAAPQKPVWRSNALH